jgi:hypothetical protein
MFALTEADLATRILGCGEGPASFNAEATRRGARVVSCDPIYQFDAAQIRRRIDETAAEVLEQARQNAHEFVWNDVIPDIETLKRVRMAAMTAFLDDYEPGLREGRYANAGLPSLPFADGAFDLALCSHFLFLYSQQHDALLPTAIEVIELLSNHRPVENGAFSHSGKQTVNLGLDAS